MAATAVSTVFRYGVSKILYKQMGHKYGLFFLLLSSYFLWLNLRILQIVLLDLLDVLMKPSITAFSYLLSCPIFHLLFVAKTSASSYSFVTLMKRLLLDQPKPLTSCASVPVNSKNKGRKETKRATGRRS